jgi:hypothetical protein
MVSVRRLGGARHALCFVGWTDLSGETRGSRVPALACCSLRSVAVDQHLDQVCQSRVDYAYDEANNYGIAYVCSHVFDSSKPVLLVMREDNDLMCMCGEFHEADETYHVIDAEQLIARDQTLRKVAELANDIGAERAAVGEPWMHLSLTSDGPSSTT